MTGSMGTTVRFVAQAAVWGSSFLLIKVALDGFTPYDLVLGRVAVAAIVLSAMARLTGAHLARGVRAWGAITASALLAIVIPYLLLTHGETQVSAGTAGTIVGATPLITLAISSGRAGRAAFSVRRVVGFVLGFLGLVVLLAPWRAAHGTIWALLACAGTATSYALGYAFAASSMMKKATGSLPPLGLAASQVVAATVVLLIGLPLNGFRVPELLSGSSAAVIALGVGASGIATLWYFQLVQRVGSANAAAVNYLVPVFAVLAGVIALGEPIPSTLVAGGVIMLLGLGIAEGRVGSWLSRVRAPSQPDCTTAR